MPSSQSKKTDSFPYVGKEQDESEKALADYVRRLRERAANGERLRSDELKMIAAHAAPAAPKEDADAKILARSKTKLAEALGISRPTLYAIFARKDRPAARADGCYHIPTWKQYYLDIQAVRGQGDTHVKTPEESIGFINVQIKKLELKEKQDEYDRKRGRYLPIDHAGEQVHACMELVKREMYRRFRQLAPLEYSAVSGDVDECRRINEQHLEDAFRYLHSGEWTIEEAIEACKVEEAK